MTEISFHFNVPRPTHYACRLLRKALRRASGVAVTGSREVLAELDRELWAFEAAEFIAHAWADDAGTIPKSLHASCIWLAPEPVVAPLHDALVNLGATAPRGFESFRRLIEVVATDEAGRSAARERWKGYARRGYAIERHEVAQ